MTVSLEKMMIPLGEGTVTPERIMIILEETAVTPRNLKMRRSIIPAGRAEENLNLPPREDPEAEERVLIHHPHPPAAQDPLLHLPTQEEEDLPGEREIAQKRKINCSTSTPSTILKSKVIYQHSNYQS